MSEARAFTDFAGNAVATVLVAAWTDELDREQLEGALSGELPFDEATMLDEDGPGADRATDAIAAVESHAGSGQRDAESGARNLAESPPR